MRVKLGIISLGCDKNRVDTENLLAYAGDAGIEFTADENEADVILINTCAFIKKSHQEAIDTILEFVEKEKKERDLKKSSLRAVCPKGTSRKSSTQSRKWTHSSVSANTAKSPTSSNRLRRGKGSLTSRRATCRRQNAC
ncbi:MAG: hypothetical protein L6V85_07445 [Clostridiales bacterium]|nr:MAG: hypothetical protein L6V85_07445 [Clostridiales bacterium]